MLFEVFRTDDGSETVMQHPLGVSYHSRFGARTESEQVYLVNGLHFFTGENPGLSSVKIFEMGFGTGLNALLAAQYAQKTGIGIEYHTCELYPLHAEIYTQLYRGEAALLDPLHEAAWDKPARIHPFFTLVKYKQDLRQLDLTEVFDVVFFDAFDPDSQPDLWDYTVFEKLALAAHPGSVLTTYSSKGSVRRNLEKAAWRVEKLRGPAGKREVVRATQGCSSL